MARTRDGTATADKEYVPQAGRVVFAPMEMEKYITIQLKTDNTGGPAKNSSVVLSNPSEGAAIGQDSEKLISLLPSPMLTIQVIRQANAHSARLRLSPTYGGASYILQAAMDLGLGQPAATVWEQLETKVATSEFLEFEDPGAGSHGRRFYRAVRSDD
jgi:hypothetical protein